VTDWRAELMPAVLRQMDGFPAEAFSTLTQLLGRICEDPYERLHSAPLPPVPGRRIAELGDHGFIEFRIDQDAGLIRVYRLVWTG